MSRSVLGLLVVVFLTVNASSAPVVPKDEGEKTGAQGVRETIDIASNSTTVTSSEEAGKKLNGTISTAEEVQAKVHAVVNKVLSIIGTRETKHDLERLHKPVCTSPPSNLRFCSGLAHAVYRHSESVPFDLMDYNAHKEFKLLSDHIEYNREQAPRVEQCRSNFKDFICARGFPHCCDIRVCGAYGAAKTVVAAKFGHTENATELVNGVKSVEADAGKNVANGKDATIATFLANGTMSIHQDANTDNSTVLVKLFHRPCLGFNLTYTPLFDCLTGCARTLTSECQAMLHTSCHALCSGQAHPTCATKQLLSVVRDNEEHSGATSLSPESIFSLAFVMIISSLTLLFGSS